jgi:hypothetical protein
MRVGKAVAWALVTWWITAIKMLFWAIIVYLLLVRTLFGDGHFLAYLAFYGFVACPILALYFWRRANRKLQGAPPQTASGPGAA